MNLKLIKKGFTVAELVIVIAIVIVLAAVLIPTFSNLIYDAKYSVDIQMVTSLNKHLALNEISEGKNETMYDALEDAKKVGYTIGSFLNTENKILWNQETDRFIAVNKKNKIFSQDESVKNTELKGIKDTDYKYWEIFNDDKKIPNINEQTCSIYWAGTESPTEFDSQTGSSPLKISVGFDSGEYMDESLVVISYTSLSNIKIRLQRGHLTVSSSFAPKIYCYGIFDTLYFRLGSDENEYGEGTVYLINSQVGFLSNNGIKGKLDLNNVIFHQNSIDENYITNDVNVQYGVHYPSYDECYFCNESSGDTHQHSFTTIYVSPTCENSGSIKIECSCGIIVDKTISQLGHDMAVNGSDIPAKCETAGQEAGQVCRRCGKREEGKIIAPLKHNFINGVCSNPDCDKTEDDALYVGIRMENNNLMFDHNFFENINKASQSFIVRLNSDITVTTSELAELLGTQEIFLGYDNGNAISQQIQYSEINYVDIDLNGHKLEIISESDYDNGVLIVGDLRIRDTADNKNNSSLILNGKTTFQSLFVLNGKNSSLTLENLNIKSDWAPIFVSYDSNKVSIKNSDLRMTKEYLGIGPTTKEIIRWWSDDDEGFDSSTGIYKQMKMLFVDIKNIVGTHNFDSDLLNEMIRINNELRTAKTYYFKGKDNNYYYIDRFELHEIYIYSSFNSENDISSAIKRVQDSFASEIGKICIEKTLSNNLKYYEYFWGDNDCYYNTSTDSSYFSYLDITKIDDKWTTLVESNTPITLYKDEGDLGWCIPGDYVNSSNYDDNVISENSTVDFED